MTREEWAIGFCEGIGAPPSKRNLLVVVSWIQAEGKGGANNPLNTTLPWAGATTFNSAGVKNYLTLDDGLRACIQTLNFGADHPEQESGYRKIRHRMREGMGSIGTLAAVERSAWGTRGLALACLPWVKLRWNTYRNLPV